MANLMNIRIQTQEGGGGIFSEVFLDGQKLRGVRSYRLEQKVGDNFPILTVDLNALDLTVDGRLLLYQKGKGNIEKIVFKEEELPEGSSLIID